MPHLFPTFDLDKNEVDAITEIYETLQPSYTAEFDPDYTFEAKKFEAFRGYDKANISPVLCLNKSFYLAFTQVTYSIFRGKYSSGSHAEMQVWGTVPLKKNYGHILIKPETLLDKVCEWIHHVEIDFEDDAAFSNKFYVIATDEEKARSNMTTAFRNYIMDIPIKEFVIEIIDNLFIIGNNKIIQPEETIAMAKFLDKIARSF